MSDLPRPDAARPELLALRARIDELDREFVRIVAARLAICEEVAAVKEHTDWWPPGQVRVLTSYGLVAWRRNWTAPSQDPMFFEENEGYDAAQMSAVKYQISLEADRRSLADKFLLSLHDSLELGNPVIVSVKSGFSENKENHQVVISGYQAEDRSFFVHDPVRQTGPTKVSEHYLLEYVNYWAIFSYHA